MRLPTCIYFIVVLFVTNALSFRWKPMRPTSTFLRKIAANQPPENLMTIDEIKSELEMRSINFDHCATKPELVNLLVESRTLGRADPDIVDNMNRLDDGGVDMRTVNEQVFREAVAGDGNLPGGMSNEMLKLLASDENIMRMMKDPKMQDMLKAVMSNGPEAMKKYLSDPDALMLLQQLSTTLRKLKVN